jgi:CubicO group peptidase (beta-lactamase class C family)
MAFLFKKQMKLPTIVISPLLMLVLAGCFPVKSVFLGKPNSRDMTRFDHSTILPSENCFEFHESDSLLNHLRVNDWTFDIPFSVSIDELLSHHKVRSFAIIQNDTIKYRYDGDSYYSESLHPSYSIAKSFTSALIGIAIEEGYIDSEQDLVKKYIPELSELEHSDKLTIEHLLNHTSGLEYKLTTDATIYYGRNSLNTLKRLKFDTIPGTKQHYLNINVHLLGLLLQRATKVSPSHYLEEKIWKPIGMCSEGQWSTDRVNQLEKTFCCLGATTLDYAKFGRLYLNEGVWNRTRIISEEWYNKSIERDTTNGSSFNYNYCWHIGLKEYGDFMANGLYKQHIYINPEKNLIIVSLNDAEKRLKAERANWWFVFRQIADQL